MDWTNPFTRTGESGLGSDRLDRYRDPSSRPITLVAVVDHGMTLNLGQGAGQAIEDAATLTRLLRSGDTDTALARYDRLRRRRTTAIWRQSRQLGKVAQASHPVAAGIRDALLRATPPAVTGRVTQSVQRWTEP